MSGILAGRRVLVVGAGTRPTTDPEAPPGNGRAIAVVAGRQGAAVACADLDAAAAAYTADLVAETGAIATVHTGDVRNEAVCERLVAEAAEALDGLDGLVVNVGVGAGGWLSGTTPQQWDDVFSVNVRSHFLLCRAALPVLDDGASIVLISSVAGLRPGSRLPAYDSSKAALAGLGRHVAMEGARRRHPHERGGPGPHRHPAGPVGHRRSSEPHQGPGGTRSPGHRLGGRRPRGVPPVG